MLHSDTNTSGFTTLKTLYYKNIYINIIKVLLKSLVTKVCHFFVERDTSTLKSAAYAELSKNVQELEKNVNSLKENSVRTKLFHSTPSRQRYCPSPLDRNGLCY